MQRKYIQVFGTVQGVGFRFYTQRIAHQFNIKGTVQNVFIDQKGFSNSKNILKDQIQFTIKTKDF